MSVQPLNNKKEAPQKPKLVLPTQKSTPKDRVSDYKWLLYGQPGIGKTTFANSFAMPLILDLEGGSNHLEAYKIPIGSWQDLKDVYELLKSGEHSYKTIVIDTVDLLYRLAAADLCATRKIEHTSDEAWGKGGDMLKTRIYAFISALQALGLGIVFISHAQEKEIKTRTMTYTKTCPSLAKSPAEIFIPLCDIVGYCHRDEETQTKRMITFKGSDYLDAKARTSEAVMLPDSCELNFEIVKGYFKGENENV